MYLLRATGEHAGYTGEMGGHQWVNGVALITRMSDYDYLTRLAKFEDITPDELFYEWGKVEKVLVIRYGGVGDLLMMTPLLEGLREFFKDAEITVACKADYFDIFDRNPSVDGIMPRPATDLPHLIHEFDQVIDLTQSIENCPESEYMNSYKWICERYGLQDLVVDYTPRYYLKDHEIAWGKNFRKSLGMEPGQKLITIHPEASSPVRSLPSQKAVTLAKMLAEAGHHVVILAQGSSYEAQTLYKCKKCGVEKFLCVSDIVEHVTMKCVCGAKNNVKWKPIHERVKYTSGRLSLRECIALMDAADYHVGIDSGFMHAAGALKMPQFAIFSSFDGQLRTSEMKNCTVYQHPYPCGPCGIHIPSQCARGRGKIATPPCMASLDVEDIFKNIEEDMKVRFEEENTDWRGVGDVPEIDMFRRECPVCGYWQGLNDGYKPIARKAGYSYYRCPECECIYTNRETDGGDLEGYQHDAYYDVYKTEGLQKENYHVGERFDDLAKNSFGLPVIEDAEDRPLHVIDFGCSVGTTLKALQDKGWEVWGIDCSKHATQEAKKILGEDRVHVADFAKINVRRDRIGVIDEMIHTRINKLPALKDTKGNIIRKARSASSTVSIARNAFDLVVMSHTLEHISNPKRAFDIAFHCLRPGGLFVSYTPDADQIMFAPTESQHLVTYEAGEHCCIPGEKTYGILAAHAGFEMVKFEQIETATSHVAWFRKPLDWEYTDEG